MPWPTTLSVAGRTASAAHVDLLAGYGSGRYVCARSRMSICVDAGRPRRRRQAGAGGSPRCTRLVGGICVGAGAHTLPS
jgi:hypothetical protein